VLRKCEACPNPSTAMNATSFQVFIAWENRARYLCSFHLTEIRYKTDQITSAGCQHCGRHCTRHSGREWYEWSPGQFLWLCDTCIILGDGIKAGSVDEPGDKK